MQTSSECAPRIFLANVGVNASHSGMGLFSPLFEDGRFEFVTIPELGHFQNAAGMVRYSELECWNEPGDPLAKYLPPARRGLVTHYDPEFNGWTYGDECGKTPRAAALKQVRIGDLIVFLARLVCYREGKFTGEAGFYLIGFLEVEQILAGVREMPDQEQLARYGHNAHLRRARHDPAWLNGFYIFGGSPHSRRFELARPFGKNEAERFLRDRNGAGWEWKAARSDLQTIGSYTRTCRCILDPARGSEEAERTGQFTRFLQENV